MSCGMYMYCYFEWVSSSVSACKNSKSLVCALECFYFFFQRICDKNMRFSLNYFSCGFTMSSAVEFHVRFALLKVQHASFCFWEMKWAISLAQALSCYNSSAFIVGHNDCYQWCCLNKKKVVLRQIHRPGRMAKLYLKGYRTFKRLSVLCK